MTYAVIHHYGSRVRTVSEHEYEIDAQLSADALNAAAVYTNNVYSVLDIGTSLPSHEKRDVFAEIMRRSVVENPEDTI